MATADQIIDSAFNRAQTLVTTAVGMANTLSVAGNDNVSYNFGFPSPPVFAPPQGFIGQVPAAPSLVSMPSLPYPGAAPEIPAMVLPVAPADVTISMPSITVPVAPVAVFGDSPMAPVLSGSGIVLPAVPNLAMPDDPVLSGTPSIPDPPVITIPSFAGQIPEEDFIAITIKDIASYWHFTDDLGRVWDAPTLSLVEDKLLEDIRTGGTGIADDVQQAIWNKAAERDLLAANEAMQMAAEAFGKRGFPVPPDRMRAQQADIADKYAMSRADKSRDVMIATADLAQKNTQFAITGLTEVERLHLQAVTSFADRMLQVARASVEAGINYFNASIARYNAKLDAYKTQSAVFEALIRSEGLKLEVFKGELDAQKIKGELDLQQVEIYKAKIAALGTGIELYKAQIEGYVASLGADKAKVDIFRAQCDAYQSQIHAEATKISAYETQVRGVVAQIEIPKAQASLATAQAQIYSTQVDAKIKEAQINIERVKAWSETYNSQISAFSAAAASANSTNSNYVNSYRAALEGYTAQAKVSEANISAYGEHFKALASLYTAEAGASADAGKLMLQAVQGGTQLKVSGLAGATSALANMATGAMSAVNGIAQVVTQA